MTTERINDKWLPVLLGYGGLIPFVGLTVLMVVDPAGVDSPLTDSLLVYGAVILSFLGGVVWGRLLAPDTATLKPINRYYVYSVLPALLGWTALLLSNRSALGLLAVGFGAAYLFDRLPAAHRLLPAWYLRIRLVLTAVVMASLLVAAFA